MKTIIFCTVGVLAVLVGNAWADTVSFFPTDDAMITNTLPDYHYGALSEMCVRNRYGAGGSSTWEADALIKFDVSSMPPDSSVSSAMLNVYYYSSSGGMDPAGRALNCYRVGGDWNEEDVTWNTQPGHVPALTSYSTVPPAPGVWMQWNVTNDVQAFVQGSVQNYGWELLDEKTWGGANIPMVRFRSKEYDAGYTPYLNLVFTPEPGTLGLLALAGVLVVRRWR